MVGNINKERRYLAYLQAKKRVEKMYPGCKLVAREGAGYYVEDEDARNLLALRYPDMAFADNVMSAYINLDIVSHWNKTEDRNSKKFRNDVKSVCVVGDGGSTSKQLREYVEYKPDHVTSDGEPEE